MSDKLTEGTWIWNSTGSTIAYSKWNTGEPGGGTGENCASLYSPGTDDFKNIFAEKFSEKICVFDSKQS
jgi:hypothetical protein